MALQLAGHEPAPRVCEASCAHVQGHGAPPVNRTSQGGEKTSDPSLYVMFLFSGELFEWT